MPSLRHAPRSLITITAAAALQLGGLPGAPPANVEAQSPGTASAFDDARARELLARARDARLRTDSAIRSYDAITRQRISVGMSVTRLGRERLLFRHENATRVRWSRGTGAVIDVLGARSVVPVVEGLESGAEVHVDVSDATPVPYFPGRDAVWLGLDVAKPHVDDDEVIHPLAEGAEEHYRYATGDSVAIRLPDQSRIRLVELKVRAREPRWNLIVGSFWFDAATAQLVQAAYRMAVPMDVWSVVEEEGDDEDVPAAVRALITPMTGTIEAVTIEHGRFRGVWLPIVQAVKGKARAGVFRVPFELEESYRYSSVNVDLDSLPMIAVMDSTRNGEGYNGAGGVGVAIERRSGDDSSETESGDTLVTVSGFDSDTMPGNARGRRDRDRDRSQCETSDTRVFAEERHDGALAVTLRIPCDTTLLVSSPELPPSIYDEGEELFNAAAREALIESLDLSLQPEWSPQPPDVRYGLEDGLLRYNRVEGISAGIGIASVLGRGYTGEAYARLGSADLEPNAELRISRSNGRRTIAFGAYRRLAVVGDWGNPLGLGGSLNSLLFARDEGFYYRTIGVELTGERETAGIPIVWRVFAERQGDADVETQFSLAHLMNDVRFIENVDAVSGNIAGMDLRWSASFGLDPHAWRALADLRAEAAAGDFDFARGALDLTLSHGIGARLDGAVTLGAGFSGGNVPAQRLWYLGGSYTVRGQQPSAQAGTPGAGDAFWLARAEIGSSFPAVRPVLFADLGWAGDRSTWAHPGLPMSGAGAGVSFMDGLFRFDVARGINPDDDWRASMYLGSRF